MKRELSSRDWLGKASAGLVLGFLLALGLSGLLARALGVDDTFFSTRGQITMWSMSLSWSLVLSFCFVFRSGPRAWLWLTLADVVVWLPLLVGRIA